MTRALVTFEDRDVRWLRLHRPHARNALDPELVDALDDAIADAVIDPGVRVIAIAGDGPTFCAGADLRYLRALAQQGGDPLPFLTRIAQCCARLEQAPKPVVAVVHGHAVAGGLELLLACDVVIAARGTLIGDGHVRHGLLPAAGSSVRLSRKVGEPLARWLILSGALVPAEAFVPCGFVHAVADRSELPAVADELLAALCGASGEAQRSAKALLTAQLDAAPGRGQQVELDAFAANWQLPHVRPALASFVDRRTSAAPAR